MKRLIPLLAAILCASSAFGQATTGTPPLGSYQTVGFGHLNLQNLNISFTIPVYSKAGRGQSFTFPINYNTLIYYPSGGAWVVVTDKNGNATWGWQTNYPAGASTGATLSNVACRIGMQFYTGTMWRNFWYVSADGAKHYFPDIVLYNGGIDSDCGWTEVDAGYASDGSGYYMDQNQNAVFDVHGRNVTNVAGVQDTNGNYITAATNGSTTTYTDTLGTTALTVTVVSSSETDYKWTNPQGGTSTAKLLSSSFSIKTNFGCSGVVEHTGSATLPTELLFPDGSKYTFSYEPTPGYSGYYTGRLASIGLPTGGVIDYTYTGSNNGIVCSDGSTAGINIKTPDGTWTYTRSNSSGYWQTTAVDPQGNHTVMDFQGIYETQRHAYQGTSTLLEQVDTCYNGASAPCTGTAITPPITQRTIYTTWPSGQESKTNYDYVYNSTTLQSAYALVTEEDDYGYGSGMPGPLLRKVLTQYASLTNVWDRPSSITVENGSGGIVAQTNYSYDQGTPVATSGTPQHTSPSGSRGNPTTISYLVSGSTYLTRSFSYYDTGNVYQSTDVNGAVTTYSYGNCGNSFPTSVSYPLSLSESMTWNCTGGVETSHTDANGQTTSLSYADANFWRPTRVLHPDGGWKLFSYTSPTEFDTYTGVTDASPSSGCNSCRHDEVVADELGRVTESILVNDPEGATTVTTSYDSDGRVASVTNPDRSGASTNGTTSTTYDALGRPTQVTQPDGSKAYNYYGSGVAGNGGIGSQLCSSSTYGLGYPVLALDAAGKKRETWVDALGRTIEVDEPNSSNSLAAATCYQFDANGNLTKLVSPTSQTRTFAYDDLGRVTSATTPESGTTTYTYDSGGNLASKKDNRGITTSYFYDTLHRLTSIHYSDGTLWAYYTYDASSEWGATLQNPRGRLVKAQVSGAGTVFTYDSMGRVTEEWECTPVNCGTGSFPLVYTYDLAGNLTSETNGKGVKITYSRNSIGHVMGVSSSFQDANHPATLATVDSTHGYWPNGAIRKLTLGNGLTETMAYNNDFQPCRMNMNSSGAYYSSCTDAVPSGNVQDFNLGYNAGSADNGDVVSFSGTGAQGFSRTYTYDHLNRLATMSAPSDPSGCYGLSWTYDAVGNRTAQSATSGTCRTFSAAANSNNRLTGTSYQYDSAGNTTNDGSHSYAYDAEDRIRTVDGGSTATYVYDAFGHRVRKTVAGANMDYVYDLSGRVVAEIGGCGTTCWAVGHVYLGNIYLAEYHNGTTYFVLPDQLGSTRVMTAPDKSILDDMDFYPFGEQIAGGTGTTHKFTSQERDGETSLDHFPARYYASTLGRFMTPDPLGGDIADPQSLNRYAYVLNNPETFVDPLGLWCGSWVYTDVWSDGRLVQAAGGQATDCGGSSSGGPVGSGDILMWSWNGETLDPRVNLYSMENKLVTDLQLALARRPTPSEYLQTISAELAPLNKLSDCGAEAVANQIPFGNKILGTPKGPADPLGTTLDVADKLSNNKYPGAVVWTLNKVGLPALSEAAENGFTKVVSFLSPFAEKISVFGWGWAAYTAGKDASGCYNKPGG